MMMADTTELYLLFARMLDYPTTDLVQQAAECARLLAPACAQAGEVMAGFRSQVERIPLKDLQATYTYTFDLQGACAPYVGHHLFGESYKRSWFMARLNEEYQRKNFPSQTELPDHIAVVLQFLAHNIADEFAQVLQNEGLRPAVDKMHMLFTEAEENPYRKALRALGMALQEPNLMGFSNQVGSENGGLDNG